MQLKLEFMYSFSLYMQASSDVVFQRASSSGSLSSEAVSSDGEGVVRMKSAIVQVRSTLTASCYKVYLLVCNILFQVSKNASGPPPPPFSPQSFPSPGPSPGPPPPDSRNSRRRRRTPSEEEHSPSPPPKKKKPEPDPLLTKTGGAYIPPARLRMMQEGIKDKSSVAYQRIAWEALKKSINGLVNKVRKAEGRVWL